MASNNLTGGKEYARVLPGVEGAFRGVDFSSAPEQVKPYRFVDCQNMYRDYRSAEGGAVETIPGYRLLHSFGKRINGVHRWKDLAGAEHLVIHAGTTLHVNGVITKDRTDAWVQVEGEVADAPSHAFCYNGFLHLLDGTTFHRLTVREDGSLALMPMTELAYIPMLWQDGVETEQRNMLTPRHTIALMGEDGVTPPYLADDKLSRYTEENTQNHYYRYNGTDGFVYTDFNETAPFENSAATCVVFEAPFKGGTKTLRKGIGNDEIGDDMRIHGVGLRTVGKKMEIEENAFDKYCGITRLFWMAHSDADGIMGSFQLPDGDGSMFVQQQSIQVFYNFSIEEFATRFGDNEGIDAALKRLPPTVRIRPGSSLDTGEKMNIKSGYNSYRSDICDVSDTCSDESRISIYTNEQGTVIVYVGTEVPTGRYYFYGDVGLGTYNGIRRVIYRIDVIAEGPEWVVQDVFDYDAAPLTLRLPQACTSVERVTAADESTMCFAVLYGEGGRVESVGGLFHPDDRLTVHATAEPYHFTTAAGARVTGEEALNGCTLHACFDDRVFLAGNLRLPNTVFYSKPNEPGYFGVLDYFNEGGGFDGVTALLPISDALCVCKEERIFYRTGVDGEDDLMPRIYTVGAGHPGLGCLGACCVFLDDPVFLSREGVMGLSKADVRMERALVRRSAMVDARLLCEPDLAAARVVEWEGYLCLFVNGHVYMADSRALYTDAVGNAQYEWFYLSGIGARVGGTAHYYRTVTGEAVLLTEQGERLLPGEQGSVTAPDGEIYPVCRTDREWRVSSDAVYLQAVQHGENVYYAPYTLLDGAAYYVERTREREQTQDTVFVPAHDPLTIGNCLYFAAGEHLFVFNNDKRGLPAGEETVGAQELHRSYYSFDGFAIGSGFTTASDHCSVPHLTKTTVPRSLTVRAKVMGSSVFTLSVMTDRSPTPVGEEVFTVAPLNFAAADFAATGFHHGPFATMVAREKEKRWVAKGYVLRDGGFEHPFGILGMAYRYRIAGRIKE